MKHIIINNIFFLKYWSYPLLYKSTLLNIEMTGQELEKTQALYVSSNGLRVIGEYGIVMGM